MSRSRSAAMIDLDLEHETGIAGDRNGSIGGGQIVDHFEARQACQRARVGLNHGK